MKADVAVVGGGITGLATAFELAEAGLSVMLLEAGRLGSEATGASLGGVRQSGRDLRELPLARAAVTLWVELDRRLEAPTGYRQTGNLRLARSAFEAEIIRTLVAEQRSAGLEIELLEDRGRIRSLAPRLAEGVEVASWCPSDGQAEPDMVLAAYRRALLRRGVRILENEPVLSVDSSAGRVAGLRTSRGAVPVDRVVLATGVRTNALLAPFGFALPLEIADVAAFRTPPLPETLMPVLGVADASIALRQELGGAIRACGASERNNTGCTSSRPALSALQRLAASFESLLPELRHVPIERVWAGQLDRTPDALPVIEAVADVEGLFLAAGFSGHGFGLGPITGALTADLVLGREPRLSVAAFDHRRATAVSSTSSGGLHG